MLRQNAILERKDKMDNKAYIPASGTGKDYYYLFSILDYDDIPIVFAARDRENHIYLCDCVEFRNIQKWVIAKTNFSILKKISTQQMSVYDALSVNDGIVDFVTFNYDTEVFEHKAGIRMEGIGLEELPDRDSIIRYPEPDAIKKIRAYSLALAVVNAINTASRIDTDKQSSTETISKKQIELSSKESVDSDIDSSRLVAA